MLLRTLIFCFLLPSFSFAQTIRFEADKISFKFQDSEGVTTDCTHNLLPQVPWWKVVCGKRNFTVNTWVQLQHHSEMDLTKATLMLDLSEGVESSGQKLVQFHSHFTHMYVESLTHLKAVSSTMDIQDGQKSLTMTGFLR